MNRMNTGEGRYLEQLKALAKKIGQKNEQHKNKEEVHKRLEYHGQVSYDRFRTEIMRTN